ncbi:hypothetical protein HYT05_00165, partial [Candidatus Kaiserbacteria bacterium]|nr:hypothetical protein [Candidatus Kaiserbacteria bacterium]
MHHLFGGGSQRGSTILAALLLVVTVGVFSTVLHYGNTLNNHLTYQAQGQTAVATDGFIEQCGMTGTANLPGCPGATLSLPPLTQTSPIVATTPTPSGTTEATKPPSNEKKAC